MKLPPDKKIPVAILGATGSVGQRFIMALADHPWFEIAILAASENSAGKRYGDATHWIIDVPLPEKIASMTVREVSADVDVPVAFSALSAELAGPLEVELAKKGVLVISNASAHRMDANVPLVIPEVNPDHVALAKTQPWPGKILTNPNCSTIGLVMALKPLADRFGVDKVSVVTMQAISGAGLTGVASFDILDNVIPYIGGEEHKIEEETGKLLGRRVDGRIEPAPMVVSAHTNRVPVVDGHLECVSLALGKDAPLDEMRAAWTSYRGEPQHRRLPSAPAEPLIYLDEPTSPQPRKHRDLGGGMAVSIGRLRECPLLGRKFVLLSHNTVRGAAGGSVLLGELAIAHGLLG